MTSNPNYKDILQDDDFIRWRLTDDSELGAYWETCLREHPAMKEPFERAVREFSKIRLNREQLSDIEFQRLRQRIQDSVARANGRKRFRRLIQTAAAVAACIAVAAGFSVYFLQSRPESPALPSCDIIVGENLEDEDIYLITGAETTSFTKDIRVQMDEHGLAVVQEAEGGKTTQIATKTAAMNKMVVPYGKRSQLELSDGTKVWINSGSTLEFPATFTENTRTVHLTGEIYVEVAEDRKRPFLIRTADFQIKVYGTKFNVTAYRDQPVQSVVLVEGQVGVAVSDREEATLQPNERLTYCEKQVSRETVDVAKYTSWKDGYLVLKQTPIADVLKLMERYYNLSFDIHDHVDLQAVTCTGKIYLSDNLDNVMKTISLLSSTRYTREDRQIYIDMNPLK
ncbi:MAG: FecR domain-containing protein [Tannerella sp.]|jgi:ferric-dicitrate binding protein FerR (iron transport regulator)|nr:FecR domain-containing protein [Tannerella sp.]